MTSVCKAICSSLGWVLRLGRAAPSAAAARAMHWYKDIPQLYLVYILHGSDRGRSSSHTAPCLRGLRCTMRMNGLQMARRGLVSLHTAFMQHKVCTVNGWQYGEQVTADRCRRRGAEDSAFRAQRFPASHVGQQRCCTLTCVQAAHSGAHPQLMRPAGHTTSARCTAEHSAILWQLYHAPVLHIHRPGEEQATPGEPRQLRTSWYS